jgi:hypothetical protein
MYKYILEIFLNSLCFQTSMAYTEDEKKILKWLIQKELKEFKGEEIDRTNAPFLALEKEYENLLKKILEKLD